MTNKEKIEFQISKTLEYSRSKPIDSTLTERWFLLDEATRACEGLPQPLAFGKGMAYILERAATPIEEYDILVTNGYGWVTNLDGTRSEVVLMKISYTAFMRMMARLQTQKHRKNLLRRNQ